MRLIWSCLVIFVPLMISCGSKNSQAEKMKKEIKSLMGKSIELPINTRCVIKGRDTIVNELEKPVKIVTYIDSNTACSECAMQVLLAWRHLMNDIPIKDELGFIYIMNSGKMQESDRILEKLGVNFPVYYDLDNQYIEKNNLHVSAMARTFLLDQDNTVILVGEPLGREKLWELYKETVMKSLKKE